MDQSSFISELSKLRQSSTFLAISDYHSSFGDVADYSIVFHVSYESLLKRSIDQLLQYQPVDDIEAQAKKELLDGYAKSLQKISSTPIEELSDGYKHFKDENGSWIKGVKLHEDTGTLHLYGTVVHKKLKQAGDKKETNSKPLTLAKSKLSKDLPVSKWRQFKIAPTQVGKICVEKLSLLSNDLPK